MKNRNAVMFFIILLIIILAGAIAYHFLPAEKKQTENIVKIQEEPAMKEVKDLPVVEKPVVLTTEDKIKKIAVDWITKTCQTYKFDGSDLTFIRLTKLNFDDCKNCYIAQYEFKSSSAGYGNRVGQIVAQVITPHAITLLISEGKVTRAVTDGKYDEVNKTIINLVE